MTGRPRIVPYTNLCHSEAIILRLCQHLSIDKELFGLNLHFIKHLAAKQLERAVDVPDFDPEHYSHQQVETPRQHQSGKGIKSVDAKSTYDVCVLDQWQQVNDLSDVKL